MRVVCVVLLSFLWLATLTEATENESELLIRFKDNLSRQIGRNPLGAINVLKENGLGDQILHVEKSPARKPLLLNKKHNAAVIPPIVQMHGLGDFSSNPHGMVPLAERLSDYFGGCHVVNVQIGRNSIDDILNSYFMNLNEQVDYFAAVVASDPQLVNGFNAIGYSQGSLVIRGYVEKYNSPPVLNFISMHGPLAGISGLGSCPESGGDLCQQLVQLIQSHAYTPEIQNHLAVANYYRDPALIPEYKDHSLFLKDINNETPNNANAKSHFSNFASLRSLCLVKAGEEKHFIPSESEWFGFYQDGSRSSLIDFSETEWYEGDFFGLKSLNVQKKVFFHSTKGGHLELDVHTVLDLAKAYFYP